MPTVTRCLACNDVRLSSQVVLTSTDVAPAASFATIGSSRALLLGLAGVGMVCGALLMRSYRQHLPTR
ncbi:hypothetical protein AB0J72_49300 [Dactylosporangium sp. NPDC049742]|uniref:hypothetical protein n=1 Tax=Dactylosporangium sp. NPDC049742 TaxID=3154737 RepID=UPI00344521A9